MVYSLIISDSNNQNNVDPRRAKKQVTCSTCMAIENAELMY